MSLSAEYGMVDDHFGIVGEIRNHWYIAAIKTQQPTAPLPHVGALELLAYQRRKEATDSATFQSGAVLANDLGLYLYMRFLRSFAETEEVSPS